MRREETNSPIPEKCLNAWADVDASWVTCGMAEVS